MKSLVWVFIMIFTSASAHAYPISQYQKKSIRYFFQNITKLPHYHGNRVFTQTMPYEEMNIYKLYGNFSFTKVNANSWFLHFGFFGEGLVDEGHGTYALSGNSLTLEGKVVEVLKATTKELTLRVHQNTSPPVDQRSLDNQPRRVSSNSYYEVSYKLQSDKGLIVTEKRVYQDQVRETHHFKGF